jgi:hypothetical protein
MLVNEALSIKQQNISDNHSTAAVQQDIKKETKQ